ncbi:MAG TPA: EAL domain-containing protein [Polyangiaceae bacterium]|nr:EAL domain-containing protein [Polyangiaceae bacterium]
MSEASLLERILEPNGLTIVFQPLYQLNAEGWRLHAVEALSRGPAGTNFESAPVLFEYVRRKREESLVDRECVTRALKAARELRGEPRVSVNVHASTLGRDQGFVTFMQDAISGAGIAADRLVVEIVEHSPFWDGRSFTRALDGLREMGVAIALDDVGLGNSNYRMVLECRPDYFKVDRYLVFGSAGDFYRRALLRSITDLAASFGAFAVAEGVDAHDDLDAVLAEGYRLVQGFLLAAPRPAGALRNEEIGVERPLRFGGSGRLTAVA